MTSPEPDAPRGRAVATPARVCVEPEGLRLGGRLLPIRCGVVPHFRLAPDRWRAALEAARDLGLTAVEACVPWNLHELSRGDFDFGARDPRRDVGRFVDLAHELGLVVVLRPGPLLGIEFDRFGLPPRIANAVEHHARTSSGSAALAIAPPRMGPVPSLGSHAFREEARGWLEAVANALATRVWPEGPIALVHLDSGEALFARAAPHGPDHHPDTVEAYRAFLRRRHGTLARLRQAQAVEAERWADVAPPMPTHASDVHALRARLDWVAFEEHLANDALASYADALRVGPFAGIPVVRTRTPDAATLTTDTSASETARGTPLGGFEFTHDGRTPASIKERTLRLTGSTPHAYATRFDVGAPPWSAPRTDAETLSAFVAACAWGLRGFNLSALLDQGRAVGALLDGHGRARAGVAPWRRWLAALDAVGHHRLRMRPRVAIQRPAEYVRLSRATHGLGAIGPAWLDTMRLPTGAGSSQERFGFAEPVQVAWGAWVQRVARALDAAGVSFTYVDADAASDPSARPAALFVPSHEFADPRRWERARAFAEAGGVVRWGPRHPVLDEHLQPATFAVLPGAPLPLAHDASAAEAVAELLRALNLSEPFSITPAPVELSVHWGPHAPVAIFLVHSGDVDTVAQLRAAAPARLRDACSDERFDAVPVAAVPMSARSGRLLVIEEARA